MSTTDAWVGRRRGGKLRATTMIALGALSAIGPFSIALYLPALPSLTADLGTDAARAELTVTACMVGLAVGQLLVGPLSDRVGRRRPLLTGMLLYAIISLACAFAGSLPLLVVLRFAQGAFGGAGIVIARSIVRDLYDTAGAARVFSLLAVISSVAPVVAPLAGGGLLLVTGWQGVFVVLCLLGFALLAGSAATLPESLPPAARGQAPHPLSARGLAALFGDRRFLTHAAVLTLSSAMLYCYISMSPFVLQHHFGLSAQQYSFAFATMAGGMVAAASIASILVRRKGARSALLLGSAIATAGAVLLLVVTVREAPAWLFLIVLFPTVSSVSMIVPGATAMALTNQGSNAGAASGVLGLLQFGSGLLAPLLSAAGSITTAMVVGMACCATAATLVTVFGTRLRHAEAHP
ncbi:multidrug effflux MFS transporter [Amycolatopsis sp. CA-128772]|uniref:multidrug effflux MFS transporter n=1 Tax=Amycolatopsis sp. CA-128772 TaxID=2073159 RepID=UPI0011B06A10|nr:multidrug effflux MFS transporter [Amycolatopsis sp. CA-128772]